MAVSTFTIIYLDLMLIMRNPFRPQRQRLRTYYVLLAIQFILVACYVVYSSRPITEVRNEHLLAIFILPVCALMSTGALIKYLCSMSSIGLSKFTQRQIRRRYCLLYICVLTTFANFMYF